MKTDHTVLSLAKLSGTDVNITADGWIARVRLLDVKQSYGVLRILVYQGDEPSRWIDASRVVGSAS